MDLEERLDGLNGEVTEGDGLDFIRGDLRSELLGNEKYWRPHTLQGDCQLEGKEWICVGLSYHFWCLLGALSFLNFLCYSSLVSILGSTTAV